MAARLDCIRKIQKEWDTKQGKHQHIPWEPPKPINDSQLTTVQRANAKQQTINDKYMSMKREVQISVMNNMSVDTRARLAVHLAMSWYGHVRETRGADQCSVQYVGQ